MLSDRFYMREPRGFREFTLIPWILGVLVGVFVVQSLLEVWFPALGSLYGYTALSGEALRHGYGWTLLSYALFHGSFMHLLLNGLGLFFIGRELEGTLGPRRLAQLTLVAVITSALFWLSVNAMRPGQVVGASGVVMAYLMTFACLQPHRPITFLIFFIIPVTMKPLWMVAILGGIDLVGFLVKELPGGSSDWIAHSAHLGGLAGGWIYHRFFLARATRDDDAEIEPPHWQRKAPTRAPGYTVNLSGPRAPITPAAPVARASSAPPASRAPSAAPAAGRDQLRAEVDRILDKINERGFGSLSAAEKRVLDEARQVLGQR